MERPKLGNCSEGTGHGIELKRVGSMVVIARAINLDKMIWN